MTRRVLWGAAALALCVGLTVSWFLNTFERVPVRRRDAQQAEARENPYLALERFLTRMGRTVSRTAESDVLSRLPEPGTLILDRGRAYHLTPERAAALFDWVDRGGYLIVAPEAPGTPDPVADELDLVWTNELREPADASAAPQRPQRPPPPAPERVFVEVPNTTRPLMVAFYDGLAATGQDGPEWQAADPNYGAHVLHFAYGRGSVSAIAHLDTLVSNERLADLDHAELISTLLQRYQPSGPVVLLTRLGIPTLGQWLVARAPFLLISAALLAGLWLWSVVPRFGAVVPERATERRELHEHLLAVGRFVRKRGGSGAWLSVVRSAVEAGIARRHPSYRPGGDDLETLAADTGIPLTDLTDAFRGDGRPANRFVNTMRALQRVERSL